MKNRGTAEGIITFNLYKNLNSNLQDISRDVFNTMEYVFGEIHRWFPEFTPHKSGHAISILENIEYLLEKWKVSLDEMQSFVLLLAAIVHDAGMAPRLFQDDQEEVDWVRKKDVREDHHNRTARFIDESPIFDTLDVDTREAVKHVSRGHRKVSLRKGIYKEDKQPVLQMTFLSALLRFADELEITQKRVQFLDIFRDREDFLSPLPEESRLHWESHLSIKEWRLSDKNEVVEIYGEVTELKGHLGIQLVQEGLRSTIDHIRTIPFNGTYLFPSSYRFELDDSKWASKNYKVEVDTDSTLDILIQSLYSSDMTPIRELVQNGIDACRLGASRDSSATNSQVIVSIDGKKIRISDNGIGMSIRIIDNYLKIVGKSFHESSDFEYLKAREGLQSVALGKFGIGVFSTFMLTDTFFVRTKMQKDDAKWYETTFTKSFCPTVECDKPSNAFNYGTQVEFEIKDKPDDYSSSEEYLVYRIEKTLQVLFLRPRISITLKHDRNSLEIGKFPYGKETGTIENPFLSIQENEFRLHASLDEGVFVGILWKLSSDTKNIDEMKSGRIYGNTSICLEGTHIEYIRGHGLRPLANLVECLTGKKIVYGSIEAVDFPKGLLEPSLNREQIASKEIENLEKYLIGCIPFAVVKMYEQFLQMDIEPKFWETISSYDNDEIFELLDMAACTPLLMMVNPHSHYIQGTKKCILNMDIPENERKLSFTAIVGKFFDSHRDMLVKMETGWIPIGSKHFNAKYAIPLLIRDGWKLDQSSNLEIDYVEDSYQEFGWNDIVVLLRELPSDSQKILVDWLIPYVEFGSRSFHTWLRHMIINENWIVQKQKILDMNSNGAEILISQAYFYHKEGKFKIRDRIISKIQFERIDQARLNALLEKWDESLEILRQIFDNVPHSEYPYRFDFPTLEEIALDFERLRINRPDESNDLLRHLSSVGYRGSRISRLGAPDYWS